MAHKSFVEVLCSAKLKKELYNSVKMMITIYLRLLKQFSKGKWFALFEQAWLMHIEHYFTIDVKSDSCYSVWKSVMDNCDCDCSIEEQRIIVSTIAYIVYDDMTRKVKEYKSHLQPSQLQIEEPAISLVESNVCLYRYGGFALHSLLQKYKATKSCHDSHDHEMKIVLRQLTVKHHQMNLVPYGIQQLNQGGLVIMDPVMLPYLRALIEKISSLVNEDKCHESGLT